MSISKAIVATDFSKHSEYAVKRAILLANHYGITLDVVHVSKNLSQTGFISSSAKEQQKVLELGKNVDEKLSNLIKKSSSSISVNTSVLVGRAADEIISYTEKKHGDLIIAGAHGQYHISDYVLGTTSGDIVRQGNTPVLLIKKEPSFSYNKILIATDFSEASKKAIEFAFLCFPEASFQLLHIVDIYYRQFLNVDNVGNLSNDNPAKDILEKLDDFLKGCNVNHKKFDKKIIGGYLADAIAMQSKNWRADLLVFGTQGRSKLHYFLMGSVAKRLLQLSDIDMLAVPPAWL